MLALFQLLGFRGLHQDQRQSLEVYPSAVQLVILHLARKRAPLAAFSTLLSARIKRIACSAGSSCTTLSCSLISWLVSFHYRRVKASYEMFWSWNDMYCNKCLTRPCKFTSFHTTSTESSPLLGSVMLIIDPSIWGHMSFIKDFILHTSISLIHTSAMYRAWHFT